MADTVVTEEIIKVKGEVEVTANKASAKKAAKVIGKEFEDGVAESLKNIDIADKLRGMFKGGNFSRIIQDELKDASSAWMKFADNQKTQNMWKKMVADANKQYSEALASASKGFTYKQMANQVRNAQANLIPQGGDGNGLWSFFGGGSRGSADSFDWEGKFSGAAKSIASFVGGATLKGLKRVGEGFKNAAKHASGFLAAIKRIAIYRAIRAALKAITQGFKEGMQNAYQWSVVTGNQFAKSMDMMATSALYLKNSLGAMTMPLMNYLAPILDSLVDKFVDLINLVNQFIATITGASSWVKALKYPAQYMEQAAGSAKELKNQLLGFDELNILQAPRGGGSAAGMDYSNMFQEMELAGKDLNFAKFLKDAIQRGDWKGVGKMFANKFNEMIASIPAANIATSLGKTINKAIDLVSTFITETNFYQIGESITTFLTNLRIDWATITQSIFTWASKLGDALLGMVKGINWSNVGHTIGELIKGIFNGVNGFAKWIASIDWAQFAYDLGKAVRDMFAGVDWNGIGRALFGQLHDMLSYVWNSIGDAFRTLIKLFTGEITLSELLNGVHHSGASVYGGVHISVGGVEHSSGGGRTFGYANGGYPRQGSYFYAGEDGAELVGQIGGRTGVMNADQMANSLAIANEGIIDQLAAVGNAIVSAIDRKDTSINANDIRIAMRNMNLRYGV